MIPYDPTDEIILKNEFYPKGVTKNQILSYYQEHRKQILQQVDNREVMLFFAPKLNTIIVKRKQYDTQRLIRLTNNNYDRVITRRVISIHSTMKKNDDIAIVDIDYDKDFQICKDAALDIYKYLSKELRLIYKHIELRYTGKTGFHIVLQLRRAQDPMKNKRFLESVLEQSEDIRSNYVISGIRNPSKPNIDLSSNKYRGGFITLHSLSILGLRCMLVDINKLRSFKKEDAIVKFEKVECFSRIAAKSR